MPMTCAGIPNLHKILDLNELEFTRFLKVESDFAQCLRGWCDFGKCILRDIREMGESFTQWYSPICLHASL